MFRSIIGFIGRGMFSERERSEGVLREFYKRNTGSDLDEELARYDVSPDQVKQMFDDLHRQFGEGLLTTTDRALAQKTYPAAAMSLVRKLDTFEHERDARIRRADFDY
ncbi:MAG: hypothetical protein ABI240_19305 [Sphingomonas sp.]